MQRFRKLLIPIEGESSRQKLLARASRLARQNGSTLTLVSVIDDLPTYAMHALPSLGKLQSIVAQDRSETLELMAAGLRNDGLEVKTKVLSGRRYLELSREVIRGGHDLLMKEAEPNQSLLFGSIDMHLLRTCPCAVWLFKPEHTDHTFTKVVAAVDPAPPVDEDDPLRLTPNLASHDPSLDRKVLECASSLAENEGAELLVVHAWSAPGEHLVRGDLTLGQDQIDRYIEDSRAAAQQALNQLMQHTPAPGGRRSVHLIKGEPAEVIPSFATSNQADLIVMGTVGRTGIPGLIMGNTAESILQRAGCSVLAVKPDSFVSPLGQTV